MRSVKFFDYNYKDYLFSVVKSFWIRDPFGIKELIKYHQYKKSVKKLEREFDLLRLLKKIRVASSLS